MKKIIEVDYLVRNVVHKVMCIDETIHLITFGHPEDITLRESHKPCDGSCSADIPLPRSTTRREEIVEEDSLLGQLALLGLKSRGFQDWPS